MHSSHEQVIWVTGSISIEKRNKMAAEKARVHVMVNGRVQGVFFRAENQEYRGEFESFSVRY